MDNPQYNWVNQMVKHNLKTKKKAKKLIDILDEMNLKVTKSNRWTARDAKTMLFRRPRKPLNFTVLVIFTPQFWKE